LNREEKAALIDEIATQLGEADAVFAVDYRGISVPQAAELRAGLRESDAVFRVVKNRLTKRAAEKAGAEALTGLLDGPIALTFVKGDVASAAKTITRFGREHRILEYRGGLMEGEPLDPDRFSEIARLPALDVLHGQFAGMVASPLTGLVRGLGSMISGLAIQLKQIEEQGLVEGEAAPAEPEPEAGEPEPEAVADPAAPDAGASEPDSQLLEGEGARAEEAAGNDSTSDESEEE
jgi:large subunit ribosomal protein L10